MFNTLRNHSSLRFCGLFGMLWFDHILEIGVMLIFSSYVTWPQSILGEIVIDCCGHYILALWTSL
uniref:Uncharacterized protein n=1 Tax=Arundo donax TaxID=35708 RepID=A0A0A8YVK2_ARUDO